MPKMPDPTSTCPFFDRLKTFSETPDDVESAWKAMKDLGLNFIEVGVDAGVIRNEKWTCQLPSHGETVDEEDYLKDYWLEASYWQTPNDFPGKDEWQKRLDKGFEKALRLSFKEKVIIDGIWLCLGQEFIVEASLVKTAGSTPAYVGLLVRTPAPTHEFTNPHICP